MNHAPRNPIGRIALVGAGLVAALSLAGCAGRTPQVGGGTTTVTVSPSSSTAASASSAPASTPAAAAAGGAATTTTTSSTGFRADRCDASVLKGTLGSGEGTAGATVVDLVLQNTGSKTCTLQGWPGVSFITSAGKQLGAAATLDRSSVHQTVTLMPSGHAHASLKIADAQNYGTADCKPVSTTRLRVYPPGSTQSIVVTGRSMTACSVASVRLLTVQAFHATT